MSESNVIRSYECASELLSLNKQISQLWLIRFKLIADNSPNHLNCPYALKALAVSSQDHELTSLIKLLRATLQTLEALHE